MDLSVCEQQQSGKIYKCMIGNAMPILFFHEDFCNIRVSTSDIVYVRPYTVVSFPDEEGTVFVVPSSWIVECPGDILKCRWPKGNAIKASKRLKAPEEDWETVNASILHHARSYESGDKYVKKYINHSDYFSSESESRRITDNLNSENLPPVQYKKNDENCHSDIKRLEAKVDCMLKYLIDIKQEQKSQAEAVGRLQQHYTSENSIVLQDFQILKSVQEIEEFESSLESEEEFINAVKKCSSLGGRDSKEAVRRILMKVLDHSLALNMSWSGGNGKTPFKSFPKILQFITVSLRSNKVYKDVTVSSVEEVIKRWLRYASDRNGGRIERLQRKALEPK